MTAPTQISSEVARTYLATVDAATVDTEMQLGLFKPGTPGRMAYLTYWHTADRRYPKVHTLLYYGDDGAPVGCLTYFPHDGTVTLCVAPAYRRQGIRRRLWTEAASRWPVRLEGQHFTPDGAASANTYVARERANHVPG